MDYSFFHTKMSSLLLIIFLALPLHSEGWIRHNQLGYLPHATKVAVYMGDTAPESFQLIDAYTGKIVFESAAKPTGPLGQMALRRGWISVPSRHPAHTK